MKKLQESDLEIGDILIYENNEFSYEKLYDKIFKPREAFYYLLDYLIAWFDPGKEGKNYKNIYHAAIWGNVNMNRDIMDAVPKYENCIVEAGPRGVQYSELMYNLKHPQVKNIYVCRLKEKPKDFEKSISFATNTFYNNIGHYSFETAWLLAVICSLRYSKGQLHQLLEKYVPSFVANYIVLEIVDLISTYNDSHQKDMIACSTLVAMIYKNAGKELAVNVFQALEEATLVAPNFSTENLVELQEKLKEHYKAASVERAENWKPIKETIVTPRQLMESPDVELIGVLPHID